MRINQNTKFLIIGLGLMGGSYAVALSRKGYQVNAINHRQEALDFAKNKGWVQKTSTTADPELIAEADIVIFALYPKILLDWVRQHAAKFTPGTIITDVTGVKVPVITEIQSLLPPQVEFIASHPMAGREVYGVENATDRIFQDANFVITPDQKNSEKAIQVCRELGQILGFAHISELSPQEHDDLIGFLSQLTHCIAIALMNSNDQEHLAKYTGDSFRDLTRIARINDRMWSELFLLNKDFLLKNLQNFEAELDKIKTALANDDQEALRLMMQKSTARRALFDQDQASAQGKID